MEGKEPTAKTAGVTYDTWTSKVGLPGGFPRTSTRPFSEGSRSFLVVLFTSPCGTQGGAVSTPNPGLCQVGLELAAQSSELDPPVGSGADSGA